MNMKLNPHIKAAFDEIVARTPDLGDTPNADLVCLTAARDRPPQRRIILTAAAAVAIVGVAGMIAIQAERSRSNGSAPATQPTDSVEATPTSPAATIPTPTTMVLNPAPLIEPGTVVCVSAGASPRAVQLCVDELGGEVIEASTANEDSFVVPVDAENPAHVVAAQNVADVLGLPLQAAGPQLIPTGTTPGDEVTSYLVIGSSDAPYAPPSNPGQGTPTTLSGVTGDGVSALEQAYTVVAGDTVASIAGRYGFPTNQLDVLVELNGWDSSEVILTPGDIVRIPPGAVIP